MKNVKRMVFNSFGESSVFIVKVPGELAEIVVKRGSQQMCSSFFSPFKSIVEIIIQGNPCVS